MESTWRVLTLRAAAILLVAIGVSTPALSEETPRERALARSAGDSGSSGARVPSSFRRAVRSRSSTAIRGNLMPTCSFEFRAGTTYLPTGTPRPSEWSWFRANCMSLTTGSNLPSSNPACTPTARRRRYTVADA